VLRILDLRSLSPVRPNLWRPDVRLTLYSKLAAFLAADLGRP